MKGADDDLVLKLVGFTSPVSHGYALPLYGERDRANTLYVAECKPSGDHSGKISDFTVLNPRSKSWLPSGPVVTARIGEPWLDVFRWGGECFIGDVQSIWDRLTPVREDLRLNAPISLLDVATHAGVPERDSLAPIAMSYVTHRFGADRADRWRVSTLERYERIRYRHLLREIKLDVEGGPGKGFEIRDGTIYLILHRGLLEPSDRATAINDYVYDFTRFAEALGIRVGRGTDRSGLANLNSGRVAARRPETRPATPRGVKTFADIPLMAHPSMIALPRGSFLIGSPDSDKRGRNFERPQTRITIGHAFALGRTTVTFDDWDAALAAGAELRNPGDNKFGRGDRPVINVSWHDVHAYIDSLNSINGLTGKPDCYRLPSEAEWEYACRADANPPTQYNFGNTIAPDLANYGKKHGEGTMPVASFAPNKWGLYDMHGNVWEWCEDAWSDSHKGISLTVAPRPGTKSSSRVLRGGSWYFNARSARSAYRLNYLPGVRNLAIGFRLARTLSEPAS